MLCLISSLGCLHVWEGDLKHDLTQGPVIQQFKLDRLDLTQGRTELQCLGRYEFWAFMLFDVAISIPLFVQAEFAAGSKPSTRLPPGVSAEQLSHTKRSNMLRRKYGHTFHT